MGNGEVVLLQNTRFRKEETKNEPAFSEELASLADATLTTPSAPATALTAPPPV